MRSEAARTSAILLVVLAALGLVFYWITRSASGRAAHAVAAADARAPEPAAAPGRPPRVVVPRPLPRAPARSALAADVVPVPPLTAPRLSLEGRLTGPGGHALFPGTIELRDPGRPARACAVDAGGRFVFELEPGRDVLLVVRAGSLPEGFLVPWGQERAAAPSELADLPPGFFGTRVRVPRSASALEPVELRAFHAARAIGRVLGPRGEPVQGAQVRLRCDAVPGLLCDARSGVEGYYGLEGLYPGTYRVEVRLAQAVEPAYRSLPAPRAPEVEVAEGGSCAIPDVVLRLGDRSLAGLVVDEAGTPVPGVGLACVLADGPTGDELLAFTPGPLAAATSNPEGRFLLEDLPARRLRLLASRDGLAVREPQLVDLVDAPATTTLEPLVVTGEAGG